MNPTPPASSDVMPFTPEQVHAMCAYLRTSDDKACANCSPRLQTEYGDGEPGCYAIAAETLEKARQILAPSAMEAGVDPTDTAEFYNLMQNYRHAPVNDQELACDAFDAVRAWIRARPAPVAVAQWVAVSERPPQVHGRYLVLTDGDGPHAPERLKRPTQYVMVFEPKHYEWLGFCEGTITHWHEPIALPAPYTAAGEV